MNVTYIPVVTPTVTTPMISKAPVTLPIIAPTAPVHLPNDTVTQLLLSCRFWWRCFPLTQRTTIFRLVEEFLYVNFTWHRELTEIKIWDSLFAMYFLILYIIIYVDNVQLVDDNPNVNQSGLLRNNSYKVVRQHNSCRIVR